MISDTDPGNGLLNTVSNNRNAQRAKGGGEKCKTTATQFALNHKRLFCATAAFLVALIADIHIALQ